MSIISSVLKMVGLGSTNIAVASEISQEDPKDVDVEEILKSNEIKDDNERSGT